MYVHIMMKELKWEIIISSWFTCRPEIFRLFASFKGCHLSRGIDSSERLERSSICGCATTRVRSGRGSEECLRRGDSDLGPQGNTRARETRGKYGHRRNLARDSFFLVLHTRSSFLSFYRRSSGTCAGSSRVILATSSRTRWKWEMLLRYLNREMSDDASERRGK